MARIPVKFAKSTITNELKAKEPNCNDPTGARATIADMPETEWRSSQAPGGIQPGMFPIKIAVDYTKHSFHYLPWHTACKLVQGFGCSVLVLQ